MHAFLAKQNLEQLLELKRTGVLQPMQIPNPDRKVAVVTCIDPRYQSFTELWFRGHAKNGFLAQFYEVGGALPLSVLCSRDERLFEAYRRRLTDIADLFGRRLDLYLLIHGPDCKYCLKNQITLEAAFAFLQNVRQDFVRLLPDDFRFFTGCLIDWKNYSANPLELFSVDAGDAHKQLAGRKIC